MRKWLAIRSRTGSPVFSNRNTNASSWAAQIRPLSANSCSVSIGGWYLKQQINCWGCIQEKLYSLYVPQNFKTNLLAWPEFYSDLLLCLRLYCRFSLNWKFGANSRPRWSRSNEFASRSCWGRGIFSVLKNPPGGTLSLGSRVWDFRLVKEPQAWKNRPLSKI